MSEKMWGDEPFWGLGYDWDPGLAPDRPPAELREKLIGLCETEMRANAKRSDDELLYPRRNLELLAEHGFLGLTVPEEYGGLGENHVAFAMICETLARYGCASTAMCYVMHMGAVRGADAAPHPRADRQVHPPAQLRGRIGTLSYSDPETGSHFWYPFSSRRRAHERRLQGQQEGVVDDVGRLRRLLRRADDEPRLQRLRRPLGVRRRRRARARRSRRCGTRSGCEATSPAPIAVRRTSRSPATQLVGPQETAPPRTTRPSTRGSWSARRRSGTGSRSARSTSRSATRPASGTSTSACGSPTTRRSRTTSARP